MASTVREAAYDRAWLGPSRWTLGEALECAVHDLGMEADAFFRDFIVSGLVAEFELGLPICNGGCSGLELVQLVLEWHGEEMPEDAGGDGPWLPEPTLEYRTGWALAWYQWKKAESFEDIVRDIPVSEVVAMSELPWRKADLPSFGVALDALRVWLPVPGWTAEAGRSRKSTNDPPFGEWHGRPPAQQCARSRGFFAIDGPAEDESAGPFRFFWVRQCRTRGCSRSRRNRL